MKTYICDKYHFYYSMSRELEKRVLKELGNKDTVYKVPICAWNYLYSYYDDNGDMSNQVAEVLYQTPNDYNGMKKRSGNKSVI